MGRLRNAIGGILLGTALSAPLVAQAPSITKLNCGVCYWESVIQQNPVNRKEGAMLGLNGILVTTDDEWKTTKQARIDSLTNNPDQFYRCDPDMTTLDGKLLITGMTWGDAMHPGSAALWSSDSQNFSSVYTQLPLMPRAGPVKELIDAPKIAADNDPTSRFYGNIYIPANLVWFQERNDSNTGIFRVRDDIIGKEYGPEVGVEQPPQSTGVLDGVLYLARNEGNKIRISRSVDGGKSFSATDISLDSYSCFSRVAAGSNQSWNLYAGPSLAVDQMHHRIYVAWSKPRACEPDPQFTNGYAAKYHDILISNTNDGTQWSEPAQINADVAGDRGFPSIGVDTDGTVYAAWVDHRNNQDLPVYDVYFARSRDGKNFEPDVKVNEFPIPNSNALGNIYLQDGRYIDGRGRDPGDYLKMVAIGENNVFVLHPCNTDGAPRLVPNDACVGIYSKYTKRRAVRH